MQISVLVLGLRVVRANIRGTDAKRDRALLKLLRYSCLGVTLAVALVYLFYRGQHAPSAAARSETMFLNRWVWVATLFVAVVYGASLFMQPRRPLVLFLRKFGERNQTILIERALAKRPAFRLVTLDDRAYVPRRSSRGVLVFLTVVGVFALSGLLLGEMTVEVMSLLSGPGTVFDAAEFDLAFNQYLPAAAMGAVSCLAVLFNTISVLLDRRCVVRSQEHIARAQKRVALLKSWLRGSVLAGPHSLVISVTDAHWKPTVSAAMELADIVLFDVSMASDSLSWELDQVAAGKCPRVAFLSNRADMRRFRETAKSDSGSPWVQTLSHLLEVHPLVEYDEHSNSAQRAAEARLVAEKCRELFAAA